MMSVSDRALELLAEALADREGEAVRIVARPGGLAMEVDEPRAADETFEHEERTVLVVDPGVATYLQDRTLDVHDTPDGPRLKFE